MSKNYLLGPFTSGLEMKSCIIVVAHNRIIIRNYGGKESIKAGLQQEIGFGKQVFSELFDKEIDQNQVEEIIKNSEYETYQQEEIDKIYIAYKMGKNQIQLTLKNDKVEKYSIHFRHKTEKYFQILEEIFPEKIETLNKPVTWWQKLLKY